MKNILSAIIAVLTAINTILLCVVMVAVFGQNTECNFTKENLIAIQESIDNDQMAEYIALAEEYVVISGDYIDRGDYSTYIRGSVTSTYTKPIKVQITFWCYGKNNRFLGEATEYITIPPKEIVELEAYTSDDLATYEIHEVIAYEYE